MKRPGFIPLIVLGVGIAVVSLLVTKNSVSTAWKIHSCGPILGFIPIAEYQTTYTIQCVSKLAKKMNDVRICRHIPYGLIDEGVSSRGFCLGYFAVQKKDYTLCNDDNKEVFDVCLYEYESTFPEVALCDLLTQKGYCLAKFVVDDSTMSLCNGLEENQENLCLHTYIMQSRRSDLCDRLHFKPVIDDCKKRLLGN